LLAHRARDRIQPCTRTTGQDYPFVNHVLSTHFEFPFPLHVLKSLESEVLTALSIAAQSTATTSVNVVFTRKFFRGQRRGRFG
jgi:hypothetical protein